MSALDTSIILAPDTLANRPAAATVPVGAIFCVTDSSPANQLQRNNGATWDDYAPSGGGGANAVTAAGTLTSGSLMIGQGTKTTAITATGTGIVTALGVNVGSAGAPVLFNGALGTPTSGTATNLTGLPATTGLTGVVPVANGGVLIKGATVTLTDAEIKALPSTPISVLSAPGGGITAMPCFWIMRTSTAAGAYTNINAAAYSWIRSTGSTNPVLSGYLANDSGSTPALTKLTTLLGGTGAFTFMLLPYALTTVTPASSEWGMFPTLHGTTNIENAGQQLTINNGGSGNLTGGNAANTWAVTPYYTTYP